jgi:hypothetical protein
MHFNYTAIEPVFYIWGCFQLFEAANRCSLAWLTWVSSDSKDKIPTAPNMAETSQSSLAAPARPTVLITAANGTNGILAIRSLLATGNYNIRAGKKMFNTPIGPVQHFSSNNLSNERMMKCINIALSMLKANLLQHCLYCFP